jgi:hypothetical protein
VCAKGQRKILILDSDTHQPVKGVSVTTDRGKVGDSDEKGFVSVPLPFDTIRFRHLKYSPEMLLQAELPDTFYLLPLVHMLPEVTVTELAPEIKQRIGGWVKQAAMEGAANAPKGLVSFDFADLIDVRKRRDRKHLKKAKEVLEKWDKKKVEE